MPHFGFTSPWSWLSYRVGWLFGAGVTKVARRLDYLTERTKTASALETIGMAVSLCDFVRSGRG